MNGLECARRGPGHPEREVSGFGPGAPTYLSQADQCLGGISLPTGSGTPRNSHQEYKRYHGDREPRGE